MTKQVSQKTLWLQYMEGLSNQVKLKTGEALQLIYPYTPWDWGGRDPVANTFTYEQYQVLNTVPAIQLPTSMMVPQVRNLDLIMLTTTGSPGWRWETMSKTRNTKSSMTN